MCLPAFSRRRKQFLIIDLIDERINLGRYKNTFITLSNELFNSNLADFSKKWIKFHTVPLAKNFLTGNEYFIWLRPLSSFIHEFCQRLLTIYPASHIIINEVYLTREYRDAKGGIASFNRDMIQYIQKTNHLYHYMYECLKMELVQAQVIDISQHFLADEKHKWGLYVCTLSRIFIRILSRKSSRAWKALRFEYGNFIGLPGAFVAIAFILGSIDFAGAYPHPFTDRQFPV